MAVVREATPADAPGIAAVHVDTWRTTYRGIVPDDYLDNLSYATRANFWHRVLSEPQSQQFVYIVEDDSGRIVGFASGGPPQSNNPDYEGELSAIYVLKDYQGKGIGRRLVSAVANRLAEMGMRSMLLWVLKDNTPSRRFYEAVGGQLLNEQQFELGGATLTEVGYGWKDIGSLL